jgi:hypothetical protein
MSIFTPPQDKSAAIHASCGPEPCLQGVAGLIQSVKRLSANHIQVAGAGGNLEEAWQARIVELKGRKVGFLAVSYASWNYPTARGTNMSPGSRIWTA